MGVATAIAAAGLAVSAASAINSASNQKKALSAQQNAINANDPAALAQLAHDQSIQNAKDSYALQNQLTPTVQPLQNASNAGLLNFMNQGTDPGVAKAQSMVASNLGVPLNTPLLNSAIAKAQSDLALGGKLSADQQNLATRQGAATAGSVGGGGLGLGRDLTARDLGLTSAQVEQQRLQNASQLGGQEQQGAEFSSNNLISSLNALSSANNTKYRQLLGTAQYAQSIKPPTVGLDPGSTASAAVANNNAQAQLATNQSNANTSQVNGYANLAGQGLGLLQQVNSTPSYNTNPGAVDTLAGINPGTYSGASGGYL